MAIGYTSRDFELINECLQQWHKDDGITFHTATHDDIACCVELECKYCYEMLIQCMGDDGALPEYVGYIMDIARLDLKIKIREEYRT